MLRQARDRAAIRPRWQRSRARAAGRDRGELVEERLDCVDEPGHRHILAATALRSATHGDRPGNLTNCRRGSSRRRIPRGAPVPAPDRSLRARLRDHAGWYLLLLQIKGAPDLTEQTTVTALADRLQLAQSSVTELVSRAQHAGLLERTPSPPMRGSSTFGSVRRARRSSRARSGVAGERPPGGYRPPGRLSPRNLFDSGSHPSYRWADIDGRRWPGRVPRPRRCCALSPRLTTFLGLLAAVLTAMLLTAGAAGAAIAPPWCGTPEPDAAGNLPDGTSPTHPNGASRTSPTTRSGARSTTSPLRAAAA